MSHCQFDPTHTVPAFACAMGIERAMCSGAMLSLSLVQLVVAAHLLA